MLSDPLAIAGIFIIGASAGAIVTYARYRALLGECYRALQASNNQFAPAAEVLHFGMEALIVSADPEAVSIFSRLFREKDIAAQKCALHMAALTQLSSRKFEAIVLDFDKGAECAEILSAVPNPNRKALVIAIASTTAHQEAASRLGAAFVVRRPLVPTEVRELLGAAFGRMLRDRQSYFRLSYELPVSVRRSSGAVIQCSSINLSQSGMAVTAPCSFLVGEEIRLAFAIPNTDIFVSAEGKIIWDDKHGKAGIQFDCTRPSTQARYFEWLEGHFFVTHAENAAQLRTSEPVGYAV